MSATQKEKRGRTMEETVQTKAEKTVYGTVSLIGYEEITRKDFDGVVRSFSPFLSVMAVDESGMKNVYMLAAVNDAFLIETDEDRCFVLSKVA